MEVYLHSNTRLYDLQNKLVPRFLGRRRVKALGAENYAPSSIIIVTRKISFTQDLSNSALYESLLNQK
jgi:hypothetical protein